MKIKLSKEDYFLIRKQLVKTIFLAILILCLIYGLAWGITYLDEINQQNIVFETYNLSVNPKLLEKCNEKIITINTEICKPIPCPQRNEGIYTLRACYNCSEDLNLK